MMPNILLEKFQQKTRKCVVFIRFLLTPPSSVSQEKVDCITVNCEPVKSAIDDLIQRLFDLLLVSLKKSIQGTDKAQLSNWHIFALNAVFF